MRYGLKLQKMHNRKILRNKPLFDRYSVLYTITITICIVVQRVETNNN